MSARSSYNNLREIFTFFAVSVQTESLKQTLKSLDSSNFLTASISIRLLRAAQDDLSGAQIE